MSEETRAKWSKTEIKGCEIYLMYNYKNKGGLIWELINIITPRRNNGR